VAENQREAPALPAFYFEIFAVSLSGLLLEIAYTRIFSFKVFYYFTYLIIGIGLLGIGAGGVAVATSRRLRATSAQTLIALATAAGGASIVIGYWAIARTQLNVSALASKPQEILKLLFVSGLLTLPFFAIGLVISTILGKNPDRASRLYGADLLGAALGATLCIPLLEVLTPPRVVLAAGFLLAVSGLRVARVDKRLLAASSAAALLAVPALSFTNSLIGDPVVAENKGYEEFRKGHILYSKWNPVFRVDVSEHPIIPGDLFLLHHDGQPGSGMRAFSGDQSKFEYLRGDPRSLPFEVLPKHPRVLVIGAAGGHEILASLFFGAEHVTGVELNPVTVSLLTDVFAKETGHLTQHPKVTLINGDGRWFLAQTDEKFDLIWFVAPDSYAAMNASSQGAFVLSESFLYTVEALEQSFDHLTKGGIVCTQFGEIDYANKPNRTTRYLTTAREALRERGITGFDRRVLVASATGFPPFLESAILVSPKPFTLPQVKAFSEQTARVKGGVVRHAPDRNSDVSPVSQVIHLNDVALTQWLRDHPYQVGPIRDDSPFFWHFGRFRDAIRAPMPGFIVDYEDTVAEQITLVFLAIAVVLAALFLLLPLTSLRTVWAEIPHKARSGLYFAALGLGFMFVEVSLIQKLTLFLGYPTYSLTVTLFGVLVFSGIGAILSGRYASRRKALLFAFLALSVLVIAYRLALPPIVDACIGLPLGVRVAITTALIAPVGLCLGSFMPIGLSTIAETTTHSREYVAWAWAVNGFFSVIASILATILAMIVGFASLLLIAVAIYAAGVLALLGLAKR
jgi:hypothetical protein